jgi:2-phosphoglycerate kinase
MNADGRLRQALLFMGCKPWHIAEIMAELQASGLKESELPGDVSLESVLKQFNYWSAERQLMEFRLAQRVVIKRDLPICILIGGTSGCGKSTLASLLASRIGVNTVVSTDHIRQLLRSQLSREEAPHLWSSSYNASLSQQSHGQYNNISPSAQVYAGYEHQTEYIKSHVLALCRSFMARRESLIVEGVHLSVEVIRTIMMELTHCIPFLLYISNQTKHTERLAIRAKYMTLEPRKNRYVKHFNNIRIIQDVLCTKADCSLVRSIKFTNI